MVCRGSGLGSQHPHQGAHSCLCSSSSNALFWPPWALGTDYTLLKSKILTATPGSHSMFLTSFTCSDCSLTFHWQVTMSRLSVLCNQILLTLQPTDLDKFDNAVLTSYLSNIWQVSPFPTHLPPLILLSPQFSFCAHTHRSPSSPYPFLLTFPPSPSSTWMLNSGFLQNFGKHIVFQHYVPNTSELVSVDNSELYTHIFPMPFTTEASILWQFPLLKHSV